MFGFNRTPGPSDALAESAADDQARYDEIVSLLLAAGYFRARVPALTPFDKAKGGRTVQHRASIHGNVSVKKVLQYRM